MNKQILITAGIVGLFFANANAQYQQPPPQISVSGSAEVKVAPDEICISAGVETRDAQLDAATRQNNERISSALEFLKKAGVPDKDVQTDAIMVQPDYGSGDSLTEPRFYRVRKSIQVKLDTLTNLENVVTGLLSHGANNIYGVDFRTTQLRKYRDQARAMAIKAAKEKAVALCKELDVKCGKPNNINTWDRGGSYSWAGEPWGWRYNNTYMNSTQNVIQDNGGGAESGGETMSIGQISISASVNVSFLIE